MLADDYLVEPGPLQLLDVKVMHGANYFSGGPVVVLRVDLGDYDEVFSNEIAGFADRLAEAVPSLQQHACSEGKPGGFLFRVREGTLLGHITEHVAIELQTLAGMDVGYGKTRRTSDPGVYNVVFRFFDEVAGVVAGKAALNLVNALVENRGLSGTTVDEVVRRLVEIREERLLGPSTQAIVDEATARGIPCLRLDRYNLVQLGTGKHQQRIRATITSATSTIATDTAGDKALTNRMLADAGIPVPETLVTADLTQILGFAGRLGPLVVKPCQGNLGQGVSIGVGDAGEITEAVAWARGGAVGDAEREVLVQPYLAGDTYRFLVVGYQVAAVVRLTPPAVTGDGKRSLAELIDELNDDPRRGYGDKATLSMVVVNEVTGRLVADRGYTLDSVLPAGETLPLQVSGSLKLGGTAEDVSDSVHPATNFLVERAVRVVGLDVAGVDVVAPDLSHSLADNGGAVIEVNAAPDFRPHLQPTTGLGRNVAKSLVDLLFPVGTPTRVPLFSVTGTAGKTTTVNLLGSCLRLAGFAVGLTSTEGLFVADTCLMRGDMTYPEQVALVLRDPTIDCAVLETAREGILRRGLGYSMADVGIVLNIHDDHVGSDDISRLDDLAYAKAVVAEQVYDEGITVLNADQDLVFEMADRVYSRIILFSRRRTSSRIVAHLDTGGSAVVIDGRHVALFEGHRKTDVLHLEDIPLTHGGRAVLNLDSILAATAALVGYGLPIDLIRKGLSTFKPVPAMLPGRLNLFRVGDFEVLLDYAHNRVGFEGLHDFLEHFKAHKIGVFDAPGDRSDEEITGLAQLAARTYDEIVLYEDPDRRGRRPREITGLLQKGLASAGFAAGKVTVCTSPAQAWTAALEQGKKGTMVVILTERSEAALQIIRQQDGC